jgi:hypothetical protein
MIDQKTLDEIIGLAPNRAQIELKAEAVELEFKGGLSVWSAISSPLLEDEPHQSLNPL